jgi:hypothetical protein
LRAQDILNEESVNYSPNDLVQVINMSDQLFEITVKSKKGRLAQSTKFATYNTKIIIEILNHENVTSSSKLSHEVKDMETQTTLRE